MAITKMIIYVSMVPYLVLTDSFKSQSPTTPLNSWTTGKKPEQIALERYLEQTTSNLVYLGMDGGHTGNCG
jgi:hypothetical protein